MTLEAPARSARHHLGPLLFVVAAIDLATYSAIVPLQPDAVSESRERTSFRAGLASTARTPAIRLPILLLGTVGLIGATLQTLLPLDLSDQDVSDVQIGVVFAISALVSCAAGLAMGRISSRVDLRSPPLPPSWSCPPSPWCWRPRATFASSSQPRSS